MMTLLRFTLLFILLSSCTLSPFGTAAPPTPRVIATLPPLESAPDLTPEAPIIIPPPRADSERTISGVVTLQGRPTHGDIPIYLSSQPCDQFEPDLAAPTTLTDAAGYFVISQTTAACLQVFVTGYLSGEHRQPQGQLGRLMLRAGDVVPDNHVNLLDVTLISQRLGSADPQADLNQDGQVDLLDMQLAKESYQQRGPLSGWE